VRSEEIAASWGTSDGDIVQVVKRRAHRRGLSRAQRYIWRRLAPNTRVVATGGEPYTNFEDCRRAALRVNPQVDPRDWTGRR